MAFDTAFILRDEFAPDTLVIARSERFARPPGIEDIRRRLSNWTGVLYSTGAYSYGGAPMMRRALHRWAIENSVEGIKTEETIVDSIVGAVRDRKLMAGVLPAAFVDPPRRGGNQGQLFGDGAKQLAEDYKKDIMWATPGLNPSNRAHIFSEWIHFGAPMPQNAAEFKRFMSSTEMNCYEWTILAALRSGATDRRTAIRYYNGIRSAPPSAPAKTAALYGGNPPHLIEIDIARDGGGRLKVGSIKGRGTDVAHKGDIITFNGAEHVLVVTGRDRNHLLVASFPTVVFGPLADRPNPSDTFVGTLEKFLQANLDNWNLETPILNNFEGEKIQVGRPGFM